MYEKSRDTIPLSTPKGPRRGLVDEEFFWVPPRSCEEEGDDEVVEEPHGGGLGGAVSGPVSGYSSGIEYCVSGGARRGNNSMPQSQTNLLMICPQRGQTVKDMVFLPYFLF